MANVAKALASNVEGMTNKTSNQHLDADESTRAATMETRERFASLFGQEGLMLVDTARNTVGGSTDHLRIVLFNQTTLSRLMMDGAPALEGMPSISLDDLIARYVWQPCQRLTDH